MLDLFKSFAKPMEFMLQNFGIMTKLENDGLFRSLFWQSVGQGEFLGKLLWLIRMTLVQVVEKVDRYCLPAVLLLT